MVKLVNRASMSSSTVGTGTITLGSAKSGYQSFAAAGLVDGDLVRYVIEDGINWEIGTGIYTASGLTLSRLPTESSNSGLEIELSGSATIFVGATALDIKGGSSIGTIAASTLDISSGDAFSYTATDNTTFLFDNIPAATAAQEFTLRVNGVEVLLGGDITNPTLSASKSVLAQEIETTGVTFNNDGTQMFIIGRQQDGVRGYSLSQPWNVNSAVYSVVGGGVNDPGPKSITFSTDGLRMYVIKNDGSLGQYNLSSPFAVGSLPNVKNNTLGMIPGPGEDVRFNVDGSKMFILSSYTKIFQFTLTTPFEIDTASYDNIFFEYAPMASGKSFVFNSDATKIFVLGYDGIVYQINLASPFNLQGAAYSGNSFNYSISTETAPLGIALKNDDSQLYIVGTGKNTVYQYSLPLLSSVPSFTYPTSVKWEGGLAPAGPGANEVDILNFATQDGGTTWYGIKTGDGMS
jgi:hypothetical protein